ncbi:MAG: Hsp70 family protein, partial [Bacteroidota bacterium]
MYCGLDFGTSNTLCAIEGVDHTPTYLELDQAKQDIPSVVFYPNNKVDEPVYGREALDLYIKGEEGRLLRSFKRLLGTKYFGSGTMLTARRKLKFHDLFRDFIQHVKKRAEEEIGKEITEVVIGRPVRFSSQEIAHKSGEQDLSKVAHAIGFKEVQFQYEPIAAAFAHEQRLSKEQLAIVIDLGGGTSDFSIIRLGPDRRAEDDRTSDILANSGIALGGTDFDSVLSTGQIMKEFGFRSTYGAKDLAVPNWPYNAASDWNRIALELYLRKTFFAMKNVLSEAKAPAKLKRFLKLIEEKRAHHLLKEVEGAKISLSDTEEALVQASFIEAELEIPVMREVFENDLAPKVKSLLDTAN